MHLRSINGWLYGSEKMLHAFGSQFPYPICGASLMAQMVKNLPAKHETLGLIPGSGRSPEERNGYSHILIWKIPWTEEPGRLQSMGSQRVGHD